MPTITNPHLRALRSLIDVHILNCGAVWDIRQLSGFLFDHSEAFWNLFTSALTTVGLPVTILMTRRALPGLAA